MTKFMDLRNITGPVFPLLTPFTHSGDVDFAALERYVEFLITSGVQTLMVTIGTSRFSLLSETEMQEVTACVARVVNKRVTFITTTAPTGSTRSAVAFAQHAESVGADAVLGVYPEKFYGDEHVAQFFETLCEETSLGIMAHVAPMGSGAARFGSPVQYSVPLLEKLAGITNFVGVKEESNSPAHIYKYNRVLGDEISIIGGAGGMRAFLGAWNWGQKAYLVGIGSFVPHIELAYYKALAEGDLESAKGFIFDYEEPFFAKGVELGWHVALKSGLSEYGLMPRFERSPLSSLSDADHAKIRKILQQEVYVLADEG